MTGSIFIRPTDAFSRAPAPRSRKRWRWLPHVAGVAERVASGLRPHGETVRLVARRNRLHDFARAGVDHVDDAIVASGEPQMFAVDTDVAHVGAARAGQLPRRHDLARGEVQHRNAALADTLFAADLRKPAVRHVELRGITAR